jgi:two-component system LytT family sensor kinase
LAFIIKSWFEFVLLDMRNTHGKIGFDDRLVLVIGLLILPLIIHIIFFGGRAGHHSFISWNNYWTGLVFSTVIWMGNRYIMIWSRTRYPDFEEIKKRLLKQSLIMLVYTLLANNLLGVLLKDACDAPLINGTKALTSFDLLLISNYASIFCSLLIVTIYESIYFVGELRKSVEEKEMLKRESLQAQLNALKIQVNPHFLFNSLNTLTAVIPENPGQAIDFVQHLSKVYRHILEVKNEQSILLKEELDVLKAYAFLLKTRFGDNLDINIQVADEKLQQKIVPLSLQILMENAIKHNIVSSAKPLRIDVTAVDGRLIVSNNLQKKNQLTESTGIGLENIRNRYRLLGNKQVEVTEGSSSFTVSIPLLAMEQPIGVVYPAIKVL